MFSIPLKKSSKISKAPTLKNIKNRRKAKGEKKWCVHTPQHWHNLPHLCLFPSCLCYEEESPNSQSGCGHGERIMSCPPLEVCKQEFLASAGISTSRGLLWGMSDPKGWEVIWAEHIKKKMLKFGIKKKLIQPSSSVAVNPKAAAYAGWASVSSSVKWVQAFRDNLAWCVDSKCSFAASLLPRPSHPSHSPFQAVSPPHVPLCSHLSGSKESPWNVLQGLSHLSPGLMVS